MKANINAQLPIILFFILLLAGSSSALVHLRLSIYFILLVYSCSLLVVMSAVKRNGIITFFFYILLGFLIWICSIELMFIVKFLRPSRGRDHFDDLPGNLYVMAGMVLAAIIVTLYHLEIRATYRVEKMLVGAFTVLTLIFLVMDLI